MNIETGRIIADVKPELINFIEYLCTQKLLNCGNNFQLQVLITKYNQYKAKKATEAQEEKKAKESAKELAKAQERSQLDFSFVQGLEKKLEETLANRSRKDTAPPIYDVREPIDKETMNKILNEARKIDKETNINVFKKEKEDVKNNLKAVIKNLQEEINGSNLTINLQNNIYILEYSGNNEQKINLIIDFNEILSEISVIMSVNNTAFIKDLDYDRSMIELGRINLLIGKLKEKLIIIKKTKEQSGGKPGKYKSTGITVLVLYKNKKYNRAIYVKDKGNTKYCKIKNEYILLSKMKVIL
jgi:hypothetical protein